LRAAGGTKQALATKLGITVAAVSQWWRIPARRVHQVERILGIPREELRPDLYATTAVKLI
jgi:DNA-binding transcriptional regulator YdaS (Cro superfamily)